MHEAALAIGMILQRFKLIDTHRYQMHLKETLTIKPDGFKIKVRPRDDKERGAFAGPVRCGFPLPLASGAHDAHDIIGRESRLFTNATWSGSRM